MSQLGTYLFVELPKFENWEPNFLKHFGPCRDTLNEERHNQKKSKWTSS